MNRPAAIILAAGKSTRMKSDLPKVLHEVCGVPMLGHVLSTCREAGVDRRVVVVGYGKKQVTEAFSDREDLEWVEQAEQLGTGHAALVCEEAMAGFDGAVLVIAGDMPLIRSKTIELLLAEHCKTGHGVTLATSVFNDPSGYGRIARDAAGALAGIVEHADCTPEQLLINEVNISYYCFDCRKMFEVLHRVTPNNAKGEYYITDAVRMMIEEGQGAGAVAAVDPKDAMGINSRSDLAKVNALMQRRIQEQWLERGVTIVDPVSTWIEAECDIGADTVVQPFSFIGRGSRIGQGSRVGPFAQITEDEPVPAGGLPGPAVSSKATVP